jgi:hypothetical protein
VNQQKYLSDDLIDLINSGLFPLIKHVDPNNINARLKVESDINVFGRAILMQAQNTASSQSANDLYDLIVSIDSFSKKNNLSFTDIINSAGTFSGCSIYCRGDDYYLIGEDAVKKLGGIWKRPLGENSIRQVLLQQFADLIALDTKKIQAFYFDNPFDLAINSGIVINPYEKDDFHILATCYDTQILDHLIMPKVTPPVGAAELARRLGVSKSIMSSDARPLGKLFRKYCSEQKTKSPQIPYEELFNVARGFLVNRGEKINRINDLIEYLNF